MSRQTVLVIRHAEKPGQGGSIGVSESGTADPNQLSVRGWQRAGALTQLFSGESARHPGDTNPDWLIAAAPSDDYPSLRSASTLTPLSRLLDLPISLHFTPGDEAALAHHLDGLDGTILVAWEHERIPELARHLMSGDDTVSNSWPDDRFDLIWLFVQRGHPAAAICAASPTSARPRLVRQMTDVSGLGGRPLLDFGRVVRAGRWFAMGPVSTQRGIEREQKRRARDRRVARRISSRLRWVSRPSIIAAPSPGAVIPGLRGDLCYNVSTEHETGRTIGRTKGNPLPSARRPSLLRPQGPPCPEAEPATRFWSRAFLIPVLLQADVCVLS
jgi:hypothetical protein